MDKLSELERELKALEIRLQNATESDLPFKYSPFEKSEGISFHTYINDLQELRDHFRNKIKEKRKEIELLKLESDDQEYHLRNLNTKEVKSLNNESSVELSPEKNNLKSCLTESDIENILTKLDVTLQQDKDWNGIKTYGARTKFAGILEKIHNDEYKGKGIYRVNFGKSLFQKLDKKYKLKQKVNWNSERLINSMKKSY